MIHVGFDSVMMKREPFHEIVNPLASAHTEGEEEISQRPSIAFKALLGVSVSTPDLAAFSESYDKLLEKAFQSRKIERKKPIYKAAQLARLSPEHSLPIMSEIISGLAPLIDRVEVYSTHLEFMKSVSVLGGARGSKIHPVEYLHLIEGS